MENYLSDEEKQKNHHLLTISECHNLFPRYSLAKHCVTFDSCQTALHKKIKKRMKNQ